MKVTWTDVAKQHLRAIHDYVAAESPGYARRLIERLGKRTRQLTSFPRSGGVVHEFEDPDLRELIEGNYRIIYKILKNRIDVIAVVHAARLMPPDLGR